MKHVVVNIPYKVPVGSQVMNQLGQGIGYVVSTKPFKMPSGEEVVQAEIEVNDDADPTTVQVMEPFEVR
jgi:hypothetical protein